jgi:hypothetical protein
MMGLLIWAENIQKTVAVNPEIFAEHRYQIVHKDVTLSYVFHPTNT